MAAGGVGCVRGRESILAIEPAADAGWELTEVPERGERDRNLAKDYPLHFPRFPTFMFPITSQDDLERKVGLLLRRDLYELPGEASSGTTLPHRTAGNKQPG
jgi:hypothetical protein